MDAERFARAHAVVLNAQGTPAPGTIGTLGEKALHATLKHYLEPDAACHEVRVGRFVADICNREGITEIQTRAFRSLRKKLEFFLVEYPVTLVYPIPRYRYVHWISCADGTISQPHRSPVPATFAYAARELYAIRDLLPHPSLTVHLILLDVADYRYLDGYSRDRKRGATRVERMPLSLVDECLLCTREDYRILLPEGLPVPFTARLYGKVTHLRGDSPGYALRLLAGLGLIAEAGKAGRCKTYVPLSPEESCGALTKESCGAPPLHPAAF